MRKILYIILLIPLIVWGQLNPSDTTGANPIITKAQINSEAEVETITGAGFYTVGEDIPLSDGGLGMTSGAKGDLIYFNAGNSLSRLNWITAGAIFSTGPDSTVVWITDLPTAFTIGAAYIYRVGGTDVAFTDGGLGFSTALQGDMLYWSNFDTPARLGWSAAGKLVIDLADSAMGKTTLTFPSTILQGDFLIGSNFSTVDRFAWTGAGNYIVSAADSNWTVAGLLTDAVAGDGLGGGSDNVLLGSDVDITFNALLDADGGLETTDDSINIVLDGTTLTKSPTGIKVTDNTFQPLEATLTDIADGTIAENLVNTANPWADNEIASSATWNARLDSAAIIIFPDTSTLIASYTYVATNATQDGDTASWLASKTNITTNAQQDGDTTGWDATKTDIAGLQNDSDTTSWDATKTNAQGYVTGGTLAGSFTSIATTGMTCMQLGYSYNIDGTIAGGPKILAPATNTAFKLEFAIPSQIDGKSTVVDSINMHFNTTVNESYITQVLLETDDQDGTGTTVVTYDTDIGNGSTGLTHTNILSSDYTMVAGKTYWILSTPVHNGTVNEIEGFGATVYYHRQ